MQQTVSSPITKKVHDQQIVASAASKNAFDQLSAVPSVGGQKSPAPLCLSCSKKVRELVILNCALRVLENCFVYEIFYKECDDVSLLLSNSIHSPLIR